MAYDSQFVLAIIHNGSPVREINGKVTLPFNSEYKIRLKNKHNYLRAKARVWIDGRKASNLGDFILKAGETLDLERFLDESLTSGNRFQFVPLSDRRVNDPTEESNGVIKVEFYREIDYLRGWTIDPWPVKPLPAGPPISPQPWRRDDNTAGPYVGGSGRSTCGGFGVNNVRSTITCNFVSNSNSTFTSNQAGATVEGGHSGQEFTLGNDFQTEVHPVRLTLKLQGPKDTITVSKPEIAERKPTKIRFCSGCGAKRMRKARFCHRCGNSFRNPR